ncbi:hypothetical protein [Variovorax sp. OV329]|uniref:hypothetical protein n=1 Tax=Variovorax sp. OV329 TaxID=1882825 RepID=UPI0008F037EB|nr:hypothetical protein [Variovorax sp. OV329]SFM93137.1 hypothetical protein SAMN05444747_11197 [Variovorax sp. OV329]
MKVQARKLVIATACLAAVLSACTTAYALSHPNFEAADEAIVAALRHIRNAQQVNGPTFGGHAGRAEQLLQEARTELSIADEFHRGIRY